MRCDLSPVQSDSTYSTRRRVELSRCVQSVANNNVVCLQRLRTIHSSSSVMRACTTKYKEWSRIDKNNHRKGDGLALPGYSYKLVKVLSVCLCVRMLIWVAQIVAATYIHNTHSCQVTLTSDQCSILRGHTHEQTPPKQCPALPLR